MHKSLKIIGKAIKWYLILDVLALAYIGVGEVLQSRLNNPETGPIDNNQIVIDNATEKIKRFFKT